MSRKRITAILLALILVSAAVVALKINDKPKWNPYLWEYLQRDENYEANEDLKDELRQGLQDINVSQTSNGIKVDVIQSFGTARSIAVLFKVTLPKEEIDMAIKPNGEKNYVTLLDFRLYQGQIKQEEIENMALNEAVNYQSDNAVLLNSPMNFRVLETVEEENALLCVLEKYSFEDITEEQILTLFIQGFIANPDKDSRLILTDKPIAVSWYFGNKGEIFYWSGGKEKIFSEAYLDSLHFCINLNSDKYQSFAALNEELKLLDKNLTEIRLEGSEIGVHADDGTMRWLMQLNLNPLVDISEVQYLQIGDEIIKCD